MRKILQIVVEGNTGSTGTIAEQIGELVLQQGWESYIAHGRYPRTSKSQVIKIENNLGVMLHGLETRLFDRHAFGSRRSTRLFIEKIKEINPDIIHLHHLHGYYINIKILFNYLSEINIPIVWTFHDCWSFTGHCANFDFVGCEKWKTECNHCPQLNEYPASFFVDRSQLNYREKNKLFNSVQEMIIISVSKWLDGLVSQSFLKSIKHRVIYNGIDVNIFKPGFDNKLIRSNYNIGNDFMILGIANPWGKRKGFNDFIELSKYVNKDEKIVLVGLSDEQIKILPQNIIGIKKTENKQDLVDLYNSSDVFMNLSVEETFGLTTAEALSCGTPAIVYNATACPEVIDSDTGIVVEKKDFNGLLNAILQIRTKGKDVYSKKCRERVLKNFNKTERFQEYIELYKEMILSS